MGVMIKRRVRNQQPSRALLDFETPSDYMPVRSMLNCTLREIKSVLSFSIPGYGFRMGLGIALILLSVVILLSACGDPESRTTSTVSAEIIEQESDERAFNSWSLEPVDFETLPSIGDIEQLRVFGDRIFVYDLAHMNVKRFTLAGNLEAVYGEGRGQGPGEFENIFSFWVHGDEYVWVVDSMTRTVSRFQYDGTFLGSFRPEVAPMRVAALSADQLVLQMFGQPELFALVDSAGEVQERFGSMTGANQDFHAGLFDAHMYPRPGGGFIWAPIHASYLFLYNENAELERRMDLIDDNRYPTTPVQDIRMEDLEQPQRTMAVSIAGGEIFVNTLLRGEKQSTNVLDRYDLASGKYLSSIRIPPGGSQYHVLHDGIIYGGSADTTFRAFYINR